MMFDRSERFLIWSIAIFALFVLARPADAQLFRGRALLPEPEAVAGQPFGVGRMSVRLPDARPGFFGERDFRLSDAQGRVFYAAFDSQPVREILREVLNRPQTVTAHFLFTGAEPLDLEVSAGSSVRMRVVPRRDPPSHDRLLTQWWEQYTDAAARSARTDEYPQLVDSYLLSMLAQRLELPQPQIGRSLFPQPELEQSLGVLLGTESTRLKVQNDIMSGTIRPADAREPLPPPIDFPEVVSGEIKDVKVEAIAMHVPVESFYVRFGNFPNYLWFSRLLKEFGGELRNLVAMRGLDYHLNARQEQQLALKESALAEILGPQVIADVALIGHDMFLREGAAMGVLFQARNNFGLATDFRSQRAAALAANKDAEEATVEIAGHTVSFLSTPDNRIRSFYAVDGDFHLVTTSRTLVRRFYEAGAGEGALGKSAEFRLARAEVPLMREDSVFAYLSADFFENLLSPHYRIEMTRRIRSVAEIDLTKMARLAAQNEGRPHATVADLVRGGFLPPELSDRADGSQLMLLKNGEVVDSIRGKSGSFTPVADISFDAATDAEARDYRQFADALTTRWQRIDPIVVAAKRFAGEEPQLERVALDVRITPLAAANYDMLMNFAGPPSVERMAPLRGNVATVEAVTRGRGPEPVHLYAGVLDTGIPLNVADDLLGGLRAMLNLKYYFGGWPSAGMFSVFGLRDDLPVNRAGFGRATAFLWQRTDRPFVTGSPDPDVLADVTPRFQIVEAERPAQLWLRIGDLNRSELAALVNGYGYFRARQITGGSLRFMHQLISQLGVAPQRAKTVAENLLGAQLVSPLGGEYKFDQQPGGPGGWYATAWNRDASRLITAVPAGFTTPPLDWLRGIELDAALTPQELSAHALVTMQRRAPPTALAPDVGPADQGQSILPAFPFKGLDWFGGKSNAEKADHKAGSKSKPSSADAKAQPEELPEPPSRPKDSDQKSGGNLK